MGGSRVAWALAKSTRGGRGRFEGDLWTALAAIGRREIEAAAPGARRSAEGDGAKASAEAASASAARETLNITHRGSLTLFFQSGHDDF